MIIYVVQPGDSVYEIAMRHGVLPQMIIDDNELQDPDRLVVGQTLVIRVENTIHTVSEGQTLDSIAKRYGISLQSLIAANPQISNPNLIMPEQKIIIPRGLQQIAAMDVNGYAFPNIDMGTLHKTLPYLTFLSIFSYQAQADGTLVNIDDQALIAAAWAARTIPIMVVTNIGATGGFSTELAHKLLTDSAAREALMNNIIQTMAQKNYGGVNIDFEYIYPEDREAFNQFLADLTPIMHEHGWLVSTAVAPKMSGEQSGLLYEAHDYAAHGRIVDRVILMTYEWGYTYGPPMAVAPIVPVRQVLNYAVSQIPPEKILMGMPNYGYIWALPFQPGTAARTVSNTGAVDIAAQYNVRIEYDTLSQAPYFYFYDEQGTRHVVWFEDARSVEAKLRLAAQMGLAGVSYWTIHNFFPQNWLVLSALYDINKIEHIGR